MEEALGFALIKDFVYADPRQVAKRHSRAVSRQEQVLEQEQGEEQELL